MAIGRVNLSCLGIDRQKYFPSAKGAPLVSSIKFLNFAMEGMTCICGQEINQGFLLYLRGEDVAGVGVAFGFEINTPVCLSCAKNILEKFHPAF